VAATRPRPWLLVGDYGGDPARAFSSREQAGQALWEERHENAAGRILFQLDMLHFDPQGVGPEDPGQEGG
jgi:hypothetical protein